MDEYDKKIVDQQYIKEEDRCAFGRGYEYSRLGLETDKNPFEARSFRWYQFLHGWRSFRDVRRNRKKKSIEPSERKKA